MKKTALTIFIFFITVLCFGQPSVTKYFNTEWLEKEVSQDKAKFSETIIQNTDGTVTSEIKDLKKDEIVRSETFKGNEPYGIWKFRYGKSFKTIDYNFPLIYSEEKCNDSVSITTNDYLKNNDSLGYKAPKISTGELTIFQYIGKNIFYPTSSVENGIQGTVYLQLTFTADGTENIVVKRGVDILLDKEAVRVLRELKFSSPATVNGQINTLGCITLPIKYSLM